MFGIKGVRSSSGLNICKYSKFMELANLIKVKVKFLSNLYSQDQRYMYTRKFSSKNPP